MSSLVNARDHACSSRWAPPLRCSSRTPRSNASAEAAISGSGMSSPSLPPSDPTAATTSSVSIPSPARPPARPPSCRLADARTRGIHLDLSVRPCNCILELLDLREGERKRVQRDGIRLSVPLLTESKMSKKGGDHQAPPASRCSRRLASRMSCSCSRSQRVRSRWAPWSASIAIVRRPSARLSAISPAPRKS